MSQSYTNLLYHLIFSTKERRPIITLDYKPQLYDYIGGIIRGLGGISLGIGGVADHVHVLAKLGPTRALSDVLRDLKANASGWMHDVFPEMRDFSWQRGYGAFTVSQSNVVGGLVPGAYAPGFTLYACFAGSFQFTVAGGTPAIPSLLSQLFS